jgi:hypothetical protein
MTLQRPVVLQLLFGAREITGIPCIFGLSRLLLSSLGSEERTRRSVHGLVLSVPA